MVVELVNTGTELMLGRILNTHQQWLCRSLSDLGYSVSRQVAVPDAADSIVAAVREALSRADLVITTGGLGPTSDDLTRESIAALLGKKLCEDAAVRERIRGFFVSRGRPVPDSTRAEAMVPEGASVFLNACGTAPGLAIEVNPNTHRADGRRAWLIMLPGPTRELRPMFASDVVPFLQQSLPPAGIFVCRTLRTVGVGESSVQEKIAGALETVVKAGVQLGYCASPGRVDVRLSATGGRAEELVREAEAVVRARLGSAIFAMDDEELEEVVVRRLTERGETLATAESCTGGYVAHRLTNVPGASAVLRAGWVVYSNEAKRESLGVRDETLAAHGAVSEEVARELAEGARRVGRTDFAIAITGIAGPTGGTAEKPVGTVFIALASGRGTRVVRNFNPWDRSTFKEVTALQALNQLRSALDPSRS